MPGGTQSKRQKCQSLVNTGPVSSQHLALFGLASLSMYLCTVIGAGAALSPAAQGKNGGWLREPVKGERECVVTAARSLALSVPMLSQTLLADLREGHL